jgi:hypothetical protein
MYLPMDADRLISENDFNFFGFPPRYRSRFHSATLPLAIPFRHATARDSIPPRDRSRFQFLISTKLKTI